VIGVDRPSQSGGWFDPSTGTPAHACVSTRIQKSTENKSLIENSVVTADEIKLGFLLLQHLRVATRDRAVHKFNVIGRSTKGEFETWLGRDISPSDKQSVIWIWDELKRARLINATGTDLVNPDDWVVVSPKGMTISEGDFAAMFRDQPSAGSNQRLVDVVTGILQRAELNADLDRIAVAQDGSPLSFLMIDLDHFKSFNDTHGHGVGDEVLKAVAQTVARVVRRKGEVYRYGGEEISVILPNHALAEATAVAERIRNEIEAVRIEKVPDCHVTASLGVAAIPETSANKKDMVTDADRALYEAKDKGRNRVCCAAKTASGTPVQRKVPARLDGDLNLRVALQSGSRSWYLLYVENQTNVDVKVERISIERDGINLTEPALPKDEDNWVVPAKQTRPIGWRPQTNPGDSLVRLFSEEGILFSTWVNVVLRVSVGTERHDYQQKLAVRVFATNGDVKQIAG
jgi:diguanylate cyclase (GGDEF)-like protein